MLLYYLFWMLMGLCLHFYYIFGTSLLTGGPAQIAVFCLELRRKGISNRVQTEWNLWEHYFWNKRDPGDLEWTSRKKQGGREAQRRACPLGAPPPSWAPRSSTDVLLPPIYTYVPPNYQIRSQKNLIPPPQPSIPVRSHLGAFSGAPPKGESNTKGFYINTVASPMMCE